MLVDFVLSEINSGYYLGRVRSILSNRKHFLSMYGISFDFLNVICGVPQGRGLGPLLFLCCSNNMVCSVRNKLLLYADDSVIVVCDIDPDVSRKLVITYNAAITGLLLINFLFMLVKRNVSCSEQH